MKNCNSKNMAFSFMFFAFLILLIPGNIIAAGSDKAGFSENTDIQLIEGKIKQYNHEKQTILLQLKNGDKVTILLDWNTTLVGYTSPDEIEKGNKVKIWHPAGNGIPTAVKIEKKLIVGC